jgi:two-component system, LuxR family, response regulator FixJ
MQKTWFPEKLNELSPKERNVVEGLLQGYSNKAIAFELHISEKTVEKHLTNIYRKLGVSSRSNVILLLFTQSGDLPH